MSRKQKGLLVAGLVILALISAGLAIRHMDIPVLEPAGPVAQKERGLIITAFLLSMIVVIPVYVILVWFSLKYRHTNKSAKYDPGFSHSRWLEGVWWAVPLSIISILAVIAFKSSHDLDPFKPLASTNPTLKIQVVSMEWKWLFIYPDQGIASVNYVNFPVNTPVDFEITSDAPMNSFWIPQLSGQIYAMPGMSTQLHVEASSNGDYHGSSANISGKGFAGMKFIARASSQADFATWTNHAKTSANDLSLAEYTLLAKPSEDVPPAMYRMSQDGLYDTIIMKYMVPGGGN